MNYTYDLDNSCNNIVIEYIKSNDKKSSMKSNHYHDFYEFYFCLGDNMTYFINDSSYLVQKYDLVFINKNVYHRTSYKSGEKERILIMFREETFDILVNNEPIKLILQFLSNNPIIGFDENAKIDLYNMIQKIVKHYETNKDDLFAFQIMLIEFLLTLKNFIKEGLLRPSVICDKKKNAIISNITNYINNNYMEKITLDYLTNKFFVDKYHLCHIFKKITGMTIIEFINSKRLSEAKRLLKSSDFSISEISNIVGFQNQNYFNCLFKRTFNQTPSEFRSRRKMLYFS